MDSADPDNTIIEFFAEILGIAKTGWVNIRTDKIYETEHVKLIKNNFLALRVF